MGPVGRSLRDRRVVSVHTEAAFLKALPKATHVITWHFKAEWYARARRLEVLATPAAGRELVDFRAAPPGVRVHFGAYHGAIISESVVAFILAWARGFFRVQARRRSIWPREWLGADCYTVAGTRAVIAGYGKIGHAIGEKLAALGVSVTGIRRANLADLPAAAKSADWFILALPSDTGTDNFLDAKLIAHLPRRCVVVNIGRGNAVDEAALRTALEKGRLAGAYLDVFRNEPTFLRASKARGALNRASAKPLYRGDCRNLVAMPHASAFSMKYIGMCFKELKDEGYL